MFRHQCDLPLEDLCIPLELSKNTDSYLRTPMQTPMATNRDLGSLELGFLICWLKESITPTHPREAPNQADVHFPSALPKLILSLN